MKIGIIVAVQIVFTENVSCPYCVIYYNFNPQALFQIELPLATKNQIYAF
jgi:hypothetical protein